MYHNKNTGFITYRSVELNRIYIKNGNTTVGIIDISEDWKKLECDVAQKLLNNAVTKSIDDFFYLMIDQYRDRGVDYE